MDIITLDRAVEVVQALGLEEQKQLRAIMDSWQPSASTEAAQEQEQRRLAEHLLAAGLIERLPARHQEGYVPENNTDRHPPITAIGRSVSETLLEDREPYNGTP